MHKRSSGTGTAADGGASPLVYARLAATGDNNRITFDSDWICFITANKAPMKELTSVATRDSNLLTTPRLRYHTRALKIIVLSCIPQFRLRSSYSRSSLVYSLQCLFIGVLLKDSNGIGKQEVPL